MVPILQKPYLQSKPMDWFLYDSDLLRENVNKLLPPTISLKEIDLSTWRANLAYILVLVVP